MSEAVSFQDPGLLRGSAGSGAAFFVAVCQRILSGLVPGRWGVRRRAAGAGMRHSAILLILASLLLALPLPAAGDAEDPVSYGDLPGEFRQKWEDLLHYDHGRSLIEPGSSFFLSPEGWRDPAAELAATLSAFGSDPDAWCQYPARQYLIYGFLPAVSRCADFDTYQQNISPESFSVVFAAEDETSPVSSMGHVFLMIQGTNSHGIMKRHSFGFVADTEGASSLLLQFLTGSITGRYTLSPYDNSIYTYVSEERRSLWEYPLDLAKQERDLLYLHLFELKIHPVKYSFFTHNCATGLSRVMAVARPALWVGDDRLFVTPAGFARHAYETAGTGEAVLRPAESDMILAREGMGADPLKAPRPTRISLGYLHDSTAGSGLAFDLLPLYGDMTEDWSSASKLSQIQALRIQGQITRSAFTLTEVKLVGIDSYPDLFRESFKINFGAEFHGSLRRERTSLHPDVHGGLGFSRLSPNWVPLFRADGGVYFSPGRPDPYLRLQGGLMFRGNFGRMVLLGEQCFAGSRGCRGAVRALHASYSRQLADSLWLRVEGSGYRGSGGNFARITAGLSYRF